MFLNGKAVVDIFKRNSREAFQEIRLKSVFLGRISFFPAHLVEPEDFFFIEREDHLCRMQSVRGHNRLVYRNGVRCVRVADRKNFHKFEDKFLFCCLTFLRNKP